MIALLIRHGDTAAIGRVLWGRKPGLHLSPSGVAQARRLPQRLAGRAISALYASPRERAQETARPLALAYRLPIATSSAVDEVDFGDWSGETIAELDARPEWQRFNADREQAQAPGGERLRDVQRRIVVELTRLQTEQAGGVVALVTHAEVIRSAVLHYLGLSLDAFQRLEISPASITTLVLDGETTTVHSINERDRQ
jgi:probable phosphoglycerate mutase